MAKITAIEPQKRNKQRVNVYIDDQFYCGMEAVTVYTHFLKVGKEVDEETLKEAILSSEVGVAFQKSIDYISRSLKTEKQMRDYLLKKDFSIEVVESVIEKLLGYKYINDENYAKLYTEQNLKNKGNRRLKQELQQKGVDKELVETTLSGVDNDLHRENAVKLAEKYMRNKENDLKTLQKLQRYLVSRGYDFDVVNSIVGFYRSGNGDFSD